MNRALFPVDRDSRPPTQRHAVSGHLSIFTFFVPQYYNLFTRQLSHSFMPQKVILLVIVIAIVAWLVLGKRGNRDAGEAARLARKMAKQEATAAKIDAQDAGIAAPPMISCWPERGRDGDIWTVQTDSPLVHQIAVPSEKWP